ncbi:MAG TPA: MFS transporter [Acidimicrobiales bacterium]|nr:MFS transporter [Acidimicrobiales bacterium]
MESGRRTRGSGAPDNRAVIGSRLSAVRGVVGMDFVLFGLVFPILPLYARHLGMSVIAIGAVLGAYSLAQLITAPLWGRLADRRGRRLVLIVALSGSALSALGLALAGSGMLLAVAVIVNGASGGSMAVAQAAIADVTSQEHHAREFGLLGAYVAMGFVVGPGLASLSALGGIRLPFILAAVFGGANLAFAIARFPETRGELEIVKTRADAKSGEHAAQDEQRSSRSLIRWLCLGAFGIVVLGFSGFESTFALFERETRGFDVSGASLSFALLGVVLATVEGRAISPVLRRFGAVSTILAGVASFGAGMLLIGLSRSVVVLGLGLVLVAIGYGLVSPVLTATVVQLVSTARRAGALGLQQSVSSLARVIGPVLGTGLFHSIGARADYFVFAGIVFAMVLPLVNSDFRRSLEAVRASPRFSEVSP